MLKPDFAQIVRKCLKKVIVGIFQNSSKQERNVPFDPVTFLYSIHYQTVIRKVEIVNKLVFPIVCKHHSFPAL